MFSISNWMTELRLECRSKTYLGLFGGCYFIGYVQSMLISQPIVDSIGRKWSFVLARSIQCFNIAYMVLLPSGSDNSTSANFIIIAMLISGVSCLKFVANTYEAELLPAGY